MLNEIGLIYTSQRFPCLPDVFCSVCFIFIGNLVEKLGLKP